MFITFEGIDGCGKTTQLKILSDYFKEKGKDVLAIREPGGNNFSEQIRELLLSKSYTLNSTTELLLFEAARSHLVDTVIKPALAAGKIVISDRFYDSTTAYQGFGRGLSIDDISLCNQIATNGLTPDISFYLDLSFEEAQTRSKNREKDRIEEAGKAFFYRVIDGFRHIAKNNPDRFIQIDASGNKVETFNKILAIIDTFTHTQ